MTKRLFILLLTVLFCSCQSPTPDLSRDPVKELLHSNEIQRKAHLENDAALLANEIADSMLSVNRAEIRLASNQEIKERFQTYFGQVKYTSWDDVREPIIRFSKDSLSASVHVQKLLDLQYADSIGNLGPHNYALFAWTAEYSLIEDQWKIIANSSTDKGLTEAEALAQPIHFSNDYAILTENDLIPEGITHDPNTGTVYLSSTYKQKIVGVRSDGSVFDFKSENEDGLWSTLGMEVDPTHNRLWVISFNANEVLPLQHPEPETEWTSKIYCYDLSEGKLLKIYSPEIEGRFGFNDLCIDLNGDPYITESVQAKVYHLDRKTGVFESLAIRDSLFVFPNGISLSTNNRYLYIGSFGGILQYNTADGNYRYLEKADGIVDRGLDGMEYYKGSLIANQPFRNRILQFTLDEENGRITSQRILEANHPDFDQPSTGTVFKDEFIYLANAQMRSGFDEGKLRDSSELEQIKLLKLRLPTAQSEK